MMLYIGRVGLVFHWPLPSPYFTFYTIRQEIWGYQDDRPDSNNELAERRTSIVTDHERNGFYYAASFSPNSTLR